MATRNLTVAGVARIIDVAHNDRVRAVKGLAKRSFHPGSFVLANSVFTQRRQCCRGVRHVATQQAPQRSLPARCRRCRPRRRCLAARRRCRPRRADTRQCSVSSYQAATTRRSAETVSALRRGAAPTPPDARRWCSRNSTSGTLAAKAGNAATISAMGSPSRAFQPARQSFVLERNAKTGREIHEVLVETDRPDLKCLVGFVRAPSPGDVPDVNAGGLGPRLETPLRVDIDDDAAEIQEQRLHASPRVASKARSPRSVNR